MRSIIDWLLDLRTLRFGQEGVEFSFARPLPAWGWAMVVIAAAALAWWTYRRLEGSMRWRGVLAGARALVLILLAVLLAGPRLIKPNETEEKDWVLVLADRSASMGIKDAPSESGAAPDARPTRDDQLKAALTATSPMWSQLSKDRVLVWMGFDAGTYDLKSGQGTGDSGQPRSAAVTLAPPVELGEAAGRRTAIGRALEQAMRRAAARPVAGIVLLSDGRSVDEVSKATMRRLEAEKVQVFTVPLGSKEAVSDIAVRTVHGPRVAFVNDLVPVEAEIERIGGGAGVGTSWGKVQLIDTATGLVLDEREVGAAVGPSGGQVDRVILTARPSAAGGVTGGEGKWVVKVLPSGPDLVAENNQASIDLRLEDRPLRVLYFDGYPRWEYRYLKNLLVRERSVTSSVLLLSEGRRFVQEGDQPLVSLPTSPEEWRAYDVIVMGDVRPEMFTEEQLAQLRDHVGIEGAGILWVGGESATPGAWASTGLADLLPFSVRGALSRGSGLEIWPEPVLLRPTVLAERYGVLRMSEEEVPGAEGPMRWWPKELLEASLGWPRLKWVQRIDPATLKPTTEILAEGVTERGLAEPAAGSTSALGGRTSSPLILSMRFGAGRSLYVATDEIWRWRYGRGEDLPERFWLQMVRMLGRESLARSGQIARVLVTPSRAEVNAPVRVAVELLDQRLVDAAAASVSIRLTRQGERGGESVPIADLTLAPEGPSSTGGRAASSTAGSRTYAGLWTPTESGKYRVEVPDPLLSAEHLSAEFEVWLPEDELRHPETDHAMLARLSDATGGKVLGVEELGNLPHLLPNRRVHLVGTPEEEALWDTPLALILLVGFLTAEWIGRRLLKLA